VQDELQQLRKFPKKKCVGDIYIEKLIRMKDNLGWDKSVPHSNGNTNLSKRRLERNDTPSPGMYLTDVQRQVTTTTSKYSGTWKH
jgi:hypothetical protein